MSVVASKYINTGKKNNFVGVFHYSRPVRSKHDIALEIYGLFTVTSKVDINGSQIAKFAWDGIIDGFEYSKADSHNESLKSAIKESVRRIKQLIVNDPSIGENGIDVNFSTFVFSPKGTYVGMLGDMDILVYKGGKIIDISQMLIDKKAHTAALVFDPSDLLITSSNDTLVKSMQRLMGLSDKEGIKERIKELGERALEGEGILQFDTQVQEKRSLKEVILKKKESIKPTQPKEKDPIEDPTVEDIPEDLVEPSGSDYIPTERTKRAQKLLDVDKEEKDLSFFLKRISSVLSIILSFVYKYLNLLFIFLKKIFGKLGVSIKKTFLKIIEGLKEKFGRKKWFKRVSAKVSQNSVGRKDFKGFKVDGYKEKSVRSKRFRIVFIVLAIVILLVLGVNFTIKQSNARATHKEAQVVFDTITELVTKAEGKVNTDRDETEVLLFKALEEFNKLPEGMKEEDLSVESDLKNRVLKIQDDMYKRVAVGEDLGNFDTYLDTRLGFGEGSKPEDITIYMDNKGNEYLLITDSALKSVYRVSLYNKEVLKLPDNDGVLSDPRKVYVGNSGVFVLDFDNGVVKAEFDEEGWFKPFEKITGLSVKNIGVEDMVEFAILTDTDNVYILDRDSGALYKSSNYGSGYGLAYSYISNDSFNTANDVLADLSVYILTQGPDGLHRYNYSYTEQKQVEAPLEVLGLNGEFENLEFGYTRGSLQYGLYLYDSVSKRFMKFEKPVEGGGEVLHPNQIVLKSQYVYRGNRDGVWDSVNDFVVDSDESYLYVLDGSAVWKVRL